MLMESSNFSKVQELFYTLVVSTQQHMIYPKNTMQIVYMFLEKLFVRFLALLMVWRLLSNIHWKYPKQLLSNFSLKIVVMIMQHLAFDAKWSCL